MSKAFVTVTLIAAACAVSIVACSSSSSGPSTTPTDAGTGVETGLASGDAGADGGSSTIAPLTWTWRDVAGAKCRDGSGTGIGVNLNPASTKTMIFLEGGGACFNKATCGSNPSKASGADFDAAVASAGPDGFNGGGGGMTNGIMSRGDALNPVKDWNMIYVPYCTGDIHGGGNPAGSVPGVSGTQMFVGRNNIAVDLTEIKALIPGTTEVFLTGASGGGFGALMAYDQVATFWGSVPVSMIDDSGPPMDDPGLPSCLQQTVAALWSLDKTVLADCGADCISDGGIDTGHWGINAMKHLGKKYPNRPIGLIESTNDQTITSFFGFGASNCTNFLPVLESTFTAGLLDIRAQMSSDPNFGTFYFQGTPHTSLETALDTRMSTNAVSDAGAPILLYDWVGKMIGGTVTNVGP